MIADVTTEDPRLSIRPTWQLSTGADRFRSFEEAVAAMFRDPRIEQTTVTVDLCRAVEFRRGDELVASIQLIQPPFEREYRQWILSSYQPDTPATLQGVRELAQTACAHFNLDLAYESDRYELYRVTGEVLRGAGAEIPGWEDFLTTCASVSRLRIRLFAKVS